MGILTRRVVCLGQDPAEFGSFRGESDMAAEKSPKNNKSDATPGDKQTASKAGDKPKSPADRPFDMWLQKQLHAMYDEITAEPLPQDLLNLIDKDAGKSKK